MNLQIRKLSFLNLNSLLISLILTFCLFSCVTQRDLEYINKNSKSFEVNEPVFKDYILKTNDALYIQINSLDDASSNIFNQAEGASQGTIDPYSAYMTSYIINNEGCIKLPVIGDLKVAGKTTLEVEDMIKDSVQNILSLPMISVRLVNQYISVLGEVRSPGHYVYSQDRFSIFNAISLAGDITNYGNRKEVVLSRNENGKITTTKIDLTKPDILSSNFYYIQPNDLIYVKPLKKRIWGTQEFPFTLIFSTITTGLVIYTFINQFSSDAPQQ